MAPSKYTLISAVLLVAINVSFADREEELKKYVVAGLAIFDKCKKEHNLPDEMGQKIINTIMRYEPLPDTPEVKCFVSCQLQTAGEMDKDGSMLWDHIANMKTTIFSEEDYKGILKTVDICRKSEKKSGDVCQRAFDSANCYYENLKKFNVSPINVGKT